MRKLYHDHYPGGWLKPTRGPIPRWWPRFSLIMAIFLLVGCAALNSLLTSNPTFTFSIDGEDIMVNLPKDFPNMAETTRLAEFCWDAELCATSFCLNNEAAHGHIMFFHFGNNVIVLTWLSEEGVSKWWIYLEEIPIEVDYEKAEKALKMILKGG